MLLHMLTNSLLVTLATLKAFFSKPYMITCKQSPGKSFQVTYVLFRIKMEEMSKKYFKSLRKIATKLCPGSAFFQEQNKCYPASVYSCLLFLCYAKHDSRFQEYGSKICNEIC
jgi:hypothetical protein